MKLSSINNSTSIALNSNNNSNNRSKQQSFKGIGMTLVNFWQFVDNGGRALQFTVEDMFGTNFPRTYKGAKAGTNIPGSKKNKDSEYYANRSFLEKLFGNINILGALKEGLREFLTGPTMCVMPVVILNIACKLAGKTSNTHTENIVNLTNLLDKQIQQTGSFNEKAFFETVAADMLNTTTGVEIDKATAQDLAQKIADYKALLHATGPDTKKSKKQAAALLEEIQNTFQLTVKDNIQNYSDADFLAAKYTVSNVDGVVKTGATKFKNYVNYIVEYSKDFQKYAEKHGSNINLTTFKNTWLGRRILTFFSMIVITGFMMSFIPKIYTLATGKINPTASAIYDEAKKGPNNDGKEAK